MEDLGFSAGLLARVSVLAYKNGLKGNPLNPNIRSPNLAGFALVVVLGITLMTQNC